MNIDSRRPLRLYGAMKSLRQAARPLAALLLLSATSFAIPAKHIEPELLASLPPSGVEYFQGRDYWHWLRMLPKPPEIRFTFAMSGNVVTEESTEFGENFFPSSLDVQPKYLRINGRNLEFSYAEPDYAGYQVHPEMIGRTPVAMAWRAKGRFSEDARMLETYEVTQYKRLVDFQDGVPYVKQTELRTGWKNLPLCRVSGVLVGQRRGVHLEYGIEPADLNRHLVSSKPTVQSGHIRVSFMIVEEPQPGIRGILTATAKQEYPPEDPNDPRPVHPRRVPLSGATVSLIQGDRVLQTQSAGPDGSYRFAMQGPAKDLRIKAELEARHAGKPVFRVVRDTEDSPPAVWSAPFELPATLAQSMPVDLEWCEAPAAEHMDAPQRHDLALIYYHTWQAWQLINERLAASVPRLRFDPPLVVRAFSTDPYAVRQGAYGNMGIPELGLSAARSRAANELRPGTIWHELGHVVMGVMVNHEFPPAWQDPGWVDYHAGFANSSTWGSYVEGFAHFFAGLVGLHVAEQTPDLPSTPGVIDVNGTFRNLAVTWDQPWMHQGEAEEFSAAALLWNLVDDDRNATPLQFMKRWLDDELKLQLDPPLAADPPARTYVDEVAIPLGVLFQLLAAPTSTDAPPFVSPPAPPWDLRQLHSVLRKANHGQDPSARHPPLTHLDELFVNHGFFADASPQNLTWDPGEDVGYMANAGRMAYVWPGADGQLRTLKEFPPRFNPKRRIPPPPSRTWIGYSVEEPNGRPLETREFEVAVCLMPPNEAYSFTGRVVTAETGRLPLTCPGPWLPCTLSIRPLLGGGQRAAPLRITADEFWTAAAAGETPLRQHVFTVTTDEGVASSAESNRGYTFWIVLLGLFIAAGAIWKRRTSSRSS